MVVCVSFLRSIPIQSIIIIVDGGIRCAINTVYKNGHYALLIVRLTKASITLIQSFLCS